MCLCTKVSWLNVCAVNENWACFSFCWRDTVWPVCWVWVVLDSCSMLLVLGGALPWPHPQMKKCWTRWLTAGCTNIPHTRGKSLSLSVVLSPVVIAIISRKFEWPQVAHFEQLVCFSEWFMDGKRPNYWLRGGRTSHSASPSNVHFGLHVLRLHLLLEAASFTLSEG